MQPMIKAIAWRFWRHTALGMVFFLALASAFSALFHAFNTRFLSYAAGEVHYEQFIFIATLLETMGMIFIINIGSGCFNLPGDVYTKPVSTRLLVGTHLGLSVFSVIVLHLAFALLFTFMGHINWPIGIPLLVLITVVLFMYAVFWCLSELPVLMFITTIFVLAPLAICWFEFRSSAPVNFVYVLGHDLPYLTLISVCATGIAYVGIKRARCGERLSLAWFWKRFFTRLADLWPGNNWPLRTPQSACFWLLWRTRGCVIPLVNLFLGMIALVMCCFLPDTKEEVQGFMIGCGGVNLFLLPFIGAMGMAHQGTKMPGLSYQVATRPISNRHLLLGMLKTSLLSHAAGWGIYLAGCLIVLSLLIATGGYDATVASLKSELRSELSGGDLPTLLQGILTLFQFILLYIIYFWAAIGLTGSFFLTGRHWPIYTLCVALFVVPIVMAFSTFIGGDTLGEFIRGSLTWLFVTVSIGGTLWALLRSTQKHFLPPWLVVGLMGIYLIICLICISMHPRFVKTLTDAALLCGLLVLPFAPWATAPLALDWNRHR
ncbi:hypothetical protein ACFL6U_11680 [Planctomycetota bacterium]